MCKNYLKEKNVQTFLTFGDVWGNVSVTQNCPEYDIEEWVEHKLDKVFFVPNFVIKISSNMAKIEEKPCSTCARPITPWTSQDSTQDSKYLVQVLTCHCHNVPNLS